VKPSRQAFLAEAQACGISRDSALRLQASIRAIARRFADGTISPTSARKVLRGLVARAVLA
jgi:hypothetical protein